MFLNENHKGLFIEKRVELESEKRFSGEELAPIYILTSEKSLVEKGFMLLEGISIEKKKELYNSLTGNQKLLFRLALSLSEKYRLPFVNCSVECLELTQLKGDQFQVAINALTLRNSGLSGKYETEDLNSYI